MEQCLQLNDWPLLHKDKNFCQKDIEQVVQTEYKIQVILAKGLICEFLRCQGMNP